MLFSSYCSKCGYDFTKYVNTYPDSVFLLFKFLPYFQKILDQKYRNRLLIRKRNTKDNIHNVVL